MTTRCRPCSKRSSPTSGGASGPSSLPRPSSRAFRHRPFVPAGLRTGPLCETPGWLRLTLLGTGRAYAWPGRAAQVAPLGLAAAPTGGRRATPAPDVPALGRPAPGHRRTRPARPAGGRPQRTARARGDGAGRRGGQRQGFHPRRAAGAPPALGVGGGGHGGRGAGGVRHGQPRRAQRAGPLVPADGQDAPVHVRQGRNPARPAGGAIRRGRSACRCG